MSELFCCSNSSDKVAERCSHIQRTPNTLFLKSIWYKRFQTNSIFNSLVIFWQPYLTLEPLVKWSVDEFWLFATWQITPRFLEHFVALARVFPRRVHYHHLSLSGHGTHKALPRRVRHLGKTMGTTLLHYLTAWPTSKSFFFSFFLVLVVHFRWTQMWQGTRKQKCWWCT